eukprot:TRINITY_DN2222_c0_g1_i1.p1 TRINITY_DN2222_c0_g1~~TRINITY_DN2222_c0_g1_i1.p1  ORF type:complete len:665 (-),score=166.85 TRINITY_DN2222_c0_g1_i1:87-2081(-)
MERRCSGRIRTGDGNQHRAEPDSIEKHKEKLMQQLMHLKYMEEYDEERSVLRNKLTSMSAHLACMGRFQEAAEVNLLLFEDSQKQIEQKKAANVLQSVIKLFDNRKNSSCHNTTFPILTKKLQQEQHNTKRLCPESSPPPSPPLPLPNVQYLALPSNSTSPITSPKKKRRISNPDHSSNQLQILPYHQTNHSSSTSASHPTPTINTNSNHNTNLPTKPKKSIFNFLKCRQTESKFLSNQTTFQKQSLHLSSFLPRSSSLTSLAKNPSRVYLISSSLSVPPPFSSFGSPFILTASQDWQLRFYKTNPCFDSVSFINKISVVPGQWTITDLHVFSSTCGNFISYSSLTPLIYYFHFPKFLYDDQNLNGYVEKKPMLVDLRSPLNKDNDFGVLSFCTSPTQKSVIAGTTSHEIFVYDLCRSTSTATINSHTEDVNSVTFLDNTHQTMVSGSDDTLIKIFDLRQTHNQSASLILPGHYDGITYIDSKMDGIHLLSNSKDQTLKYWDIRMCSNKTDKTPNYNNNNNNTHNQNNKIEEDEDEEEEGEREDYRSVDWKSIPRREKKEGDKSVLTMEGHSVKKTLIRCKFAEGDLGNKWCASGSEDGKVVIWDLETGKMERRLERKRVRRDGGLIRDFIWEREGRCIVGGGFDGEVVRWSNGRENEKEEECL